MLRAGVGRAGECAGEHWGQGRIGRAILMEEDGVGRAWRGGLQREGNGDEGSRVQPVGWQAFLGRWPTRNQAALLGKCRVQAASEDAASRPT